MAVEQGVYLTVGLKQHALCKDFLEAVRVITTGVKMSAVCPCGVTVFVDLEGNIMVKPSSELCNQTESVT